MNEFVYLIILKLSDITDMQKINSNLNKHHIPYTDVSFVREH